MKKLTPAQTRLPIICFSMAKMLGPGWQTQRGENPVRFYLVRSDGLRILARCHSNLRHGPGRDEISFSVPGTGKPTLVMLINRKPASFVTYFRRLIPEFEKARAGLELKKNAAARKRRDLYEQTNEVARLTGGEINGRAVHFGHGKPEQISGVIELESPTRWTVHLAAPSITGVLIAELVGIWNEKSPRHG